MASYWDRSVYCSPLFEPLSLDELLTSAASTDDTEEVEFDIADPAPEYIMDLLKTATPADFNNSEHLQWNYVIRQGVVWKIDVAPADFQPQSQDEADIIAMLAEEHFSS